MIELEDGRRIYGPLGNSGPGSEWWWAVRSPGLWVSHMVPTQGEAEAGIRRTIGMAKIVKRL